MAAPKDDGMANSNSEEVSGLPPDIWMLRPCEIYQDEYKECTSIKGRFQQYYIYGNNLDCSKWKNDFENCYKFRNTRSIEAVEKVLENEKERRETRIQNAQANDIWEYRSAPPEDWSKPLPEWEKSREHSVLNRVQRMKEKSGTFSGSSDMVKSSCTIM